MVVFSLVHLPTVKMGMWPPSVPTKNSIDVCEKVPRRIKNVQTNSLDRKILRLLLERRATALRNNKDKIKNCGKRERDDMIQ